MNIYAIKRINNPWKNNSSHEIVTKLGETNNWGKLYTLDSGKPMIENGYISVSHSQNLLVIAQGENEIGIDCEAIRSLHPALIKKLNLNSTNPILDWCTREALIKLLDDKHYLLKMDTTSFFIEEVLVDAAFCVVLASYQTIKPITIQYLDENLNFLKQIL